MAPSYLWEKSASLECTWMFSQQAPVVKCNDSDNNNNGNNNNENNNNDDTNNNNDKNYNNKSALVFLTGFSWLD